MRFAILVVVLFGTLSSCDHSPVTILEQAESHFRDGQWSHVVGACNQHLSGDPENQTAISLRGRAYLAMNEYEKAIADFSRLIELNPEDCDPFYRRGMAYEALDQTELADADKMKARRLDPMRKSAYAYDIGNFIDKPQLDGAVAPPSTDEDGEAVATEDDAAETADEMLAEQERAKRTDLDRELDRDFYDREAQEDEATAAAAAAGKSPPLADSLPSDVRRRIRQGELDQDFVRGAVLGYRDMLEDNAATPRPRLQSSMPSSSLINLDDLLGPAPPTKRGEEEVVDEESELKRLAPPISTALPPGYGGLQPNGGVGSSLGIPRANPMGGKLGAQVPGAAFQPGGIGIPGLPRSSPGITPSPYRLHANPIYDKPAANPTGKPAANPTVKPTTKPTLSTSLPTGVPGVSGLGTQAGGAPGTARRLPPMLPPSGIPVQIDRP